MRALAPPLRPPPPAIPPRVHRFSMDLSSSPLLLFWCLNSSTPAPFPVLLLLLLLPLLLLFVATFMLLCCSSFPSPPHPPLQIAARAGAPTRGCESSVLEYRMMWLKTVLVRTRKDSFVLLLRYEEKIPQHFTLLPMIDDGAGVR